MGASLVPFASHETNSVWCNGPAWTPCVQLLVVRKNSFLKYVNRLSSDTIGCSARLTSTGIQTCSTLPSHQDLKAHGIIYCYPNEASIRELALSMMAFRWQCWQMSNNLSFLQWRRSSNRKSISRFKWKYFPSRNCDRQIKNQWLWSA